ncbi:hypothetical protein BV898_18978 [Hypsibius exemplaris]|uniref:Thyroglobulin type-1 domain-containing protein n=1 Tax=Hypsibius exemplaris TaxID=2072580 RepID=A0A9X6NKW5_HYPEX|nr:hypothetical protein BV898_18978 [Hypsibius exemplaris]
MEQPHFLPLSVMVLSFSGIFSSSSISLPPGQNITCLEHRNRSAALAPRSSPSFRKGMTLNGSGLSGAATTERGNQSEWIPQCEENGMYKMKQKRQNGEAFCVLPETGEIIHDTARTQGHNASSRDHLFCQCFVQRREAASGDSSQQILACDEQTGFYNTLQRLPSGSAQCFTLFGSPISDQFVYNITMERLNPCVQWTQFVTMAPMRAITRSVEHLLASVRGRLDKDSEYT